MRTYLILSLSLLWATVAQGQSNTDMMKAIMGGQGQVEQDNSPFKPLGFTGSYTWVINSYKGGTLDKDSPMLLRMAFDDEHMAWEPQARPNEGAMRMIFDLKNKVNYTLMTDEKGKRTGVKMKAMRITMNDADHASDEATQVVRTQETKVIDEHTCRKYTYKDEEGSGVAWIAEDVKFNAFEALGSMVGARADRWQMAPYQGMVMENAWTSADGGERVEMSTRDLVIGKVDKALFSTDGYELQDMTNLPVFGR